MIVDSPFRDGQRSINTRHYRKETLFKKEIEFSGTVIVETIVQVRSQNREFRIKNSFSKRD